MYGVKWMLREEERINRVPKSKSTCEACQPRQPRRMTDNRPRRAAFLVERPPAGWWINIPIGFLVLECFHSSLFSFLTFYRRKILQHRVRAGVGCADREERWREEHGIGRRSSE